MSVLTPEIREMLMSISTATLTTAMFKRGFRNIFFQGPQRLNPGENMVGEAYTLRYIPAREDLDLLESFADRNNPQRKGVEECPEGAVFVIDSRQDASAASAGGILVTRLQTKGVAGIVTDGGFRDTPEISELAMPAYHTRPSAPTNLISHHAVALNDPIACGGVSVFPGDVIVGDGEGVVCIPAHLVEQIATESVEMTIFEDFVLEMVQEGVSTFGLYPPTDPDTAEKFAAWRQRNNR
ncbi:MAG: ribonuclease activity regulator RraA [Shimia sp.]|uniref:ribonuclease activity regulator RraA n=1 Tax=Shimia sp. TaxID=1954381 RepID=UPI0040580219